MARSLYLASLEPRTGRSLVTLGVMELLTSRIGNVGYFRPVVVSADIPDPRTELIVQRFGLDATNHRLSAYTAEQIDHLLADGDADDVFKTILEHYKAVEEHHDFVLVDGTDYTGMSAALEFDFNAQVANHLGAPVLPVVNGDGRSVADVIDALRIARESLLAEGCTLAAAVVNRVAAEDVDEVRRLLGRSLHSEPVWVIPEVAMLGMPTVREIADELDAVILHDGGATLDREVSAIKIAAMTLPNVLSHIDEGRLLVTPGDRSDIIVGALASRLATTFPNIAALVLTGGHAPDPQVVRLIEGLAEVPVPVLAVELDTYESAGVIAATPAVIRPDNERKVSTALLLFEEHVDTEALATTIEVTRTERVTPLMFEYALRQRARADRRHIVLPEGTEPRILKAADVLLRRRVVDLTLLGNVREVRERITSLGLDLGEASIIEPASSDLRERFAEQYLELRRHKGIEIDFAWQAMADVSYFGTMMVHNDLADGMVSGSVHTTQHTVRPGFEIIRTRPGVSVVSSVFLMLLADRVLVYGDCAVNPEPDAEELADIAISSAATAAQFGIEPRIAMLSYSTGVSGKGRAVERVREATELVRQRREDLEVEGPIQYDAAIDASVGEAKLPGSAVAGRATVFIFPDLNTGNNTYKAVQRSSGAVAVGPVLQGLNKPINDLSRGCTVDDIVNTVTITAVQAQDG